MRFTLFLFLFVLGIIFNSRAQRVIYFSPFQNDDIHFNATVKKVLRKNNITKDSLMEIINRKIVDGLNNNDRIVFADSTFYKSLADSSKLTRLLTTTHIKAMAGKKDLNRLKVHLLRSPFYSGRVFTEGGNETMRQVVEKSKADYLVLLNDMKICHSFIIQYEVYDKNFNRVYGDIFQMKNSFTRDMYLSAFFFQFDRFMNSFDEHLRKIIP